MNSRQVGLRESLGAWILGMRLNKFYLLLATISWVKCALLFILVAMLMPSDQRPGYSPDSFLYETMARNLLSGGGLSLSSGPPYQPTMFKEPLYPVVIAAFKAVFGDHMDAVIFFQFLLNPLIAILVFLIGTRLFGETVARPSALLVALMPVYGESAFNVMPEGFFMVFFLSAMLLLLTLETDHAPRRFVLAGALLGVASLFKNILLPLALLYPIAFLVRHRTSLNRHFATNALLFLLAFSVVTTPWMWRNQRQLGLFAISARGGALFSHQAAWAANSTSDEWKAYSTYLLSGTLAQRLYPHVIGDNLGEYEYAVIMRREYLAKLARQYREGEVESILVSEGLRDSLRHPFRFAALSILITLQSIKYLVPQDLLSITGPPAAPWLLPAIRSLLTLGGVFFIFLTLRGILSCRGRLNDLWLVLTTTAYFHLVSASLGVVPGAILRYIMPVSVFYSFFIVIAVLGPKWRLERAL